MASASAFSYPQLNKFKISRLGRKLQLTDDQRTLVALPKDVPERTWAEILQKEDTDLFLFEIREDIIEETLRICYDKYMEKQNALFTVHCAAQAWLKLIDWHFYRHDPGEDPSSYPPCCIPKRRESWIPDQLPDPSPKDSWCKHELNVIEDTPDDAIQKWPSSSSLNYPVVDDIPSDYWFPGKINVPEEMRRKPKKVDSISYDELSSSLATPSIDELAAESEVLQKITDYSTTELSEKRSILSGLKNTTPVNGSLRGAGDSMVDRLKTKVKKPTDKSKVFQRSGYSRSRAGLPPLDSASKISAISDCRLRNLRLDTQYEISSEKMDTPPGETVKRK